MAIKSGHSFPKEFGFHGSAGTQHVRGYARGGHAEAGEGKADIKQDKKMIAAAVHKHEAHDHKGEAPTKFARGGLKGMKPRLPRAFKPTAGRFRSPIGGGKTPAIGAARTMPAPPVTSLPYGNTGSDEPSMPDQGIPQMSKGGRHGKKR